MGDVNRRWVSEVQRGARLLFWVVLVSVLVTNLATASVAVLGGTRQDLRYVAFVPAIAAFVLLMGIYALTTRVPCRRGTEALDAPRRALRVCVVLAVVGRCGRLAVKYIPPMPQSLCVSVGETVVHTVGMFLLFLYLARLAERFDETRLSSSFRLIAWVGPIVSLLLSFGTARISEGLGLSHSTYVLFLVLSVVLGLVAWIWALRLFWKFGTRIQVAAQGRCINCGYSHEGLASPVCPECGLLF